ncbi:hypothetical protein VTK56DRAFT_1227 [Thermocarpiscus australiensis]
MAANITTPERPDSTLHLRRILCLHGGGTNARIFRAQCRSLRARLSAHFRLVFADAPFFSGPGPDVESVYAEWGPFRSWMRPQPGTGPRGWGQGAVLDFEAVDEALVAAMREDDWLGASGRWVGLLGFSQGARLAGCLLLRQQLQQQQQEEEEEARDSWLHASSLQPERERPLSAFRFNFAVLMAGRGPLATDTENPVLLRLPTVHVHGTLDAGLVTHRQLLHCCCAEGSARLVEWCGDHRVPIKSEDVAPVVEAMLDVARESGAIVTK